MPTSRRWQWLKDATGETTIRGVARACGVSHPTVSRWLKSGVPMFTLCELTVKFHQDPIETLIIWGVLREELVPLLNYESMVRWFPYQVLVDESYRRVSVYAEGPDPQRRTAVDTTRK